MLQDVEAGRPVEIDVLLAAPREIGAALGEPTPYMDASLGLARLQAQTLGLSSRNSVRVSNRGRIGVAAESRAIAHQSNR